MSGAAVTVTPVFATPFATVPVSVPGVADGSLAALLEAFATTHRDAAARPDPLLSRSREELFESTDERIGVLRREMLAGLAAAVLATNPATAEELGRLEVQARARVVIIRPDG